MDITTRFGSKFFYNFDDMLRGNVSKMEVRDIPAIVHEFFRFFSTGWTEFAIFLPTMAKKEFK